MINSADTEKPATYKQRCTLYGMTGNPEYLDKKMKDWEAGTWIRRLQGKTSPCERVGRALVDTGMGNHNDH